MVWNKQTAFSYINKLPEQYRANVSIIGQDTGYITNIRFINKDCGHETVSTVGSLLQRKQFDLCLKCTRKKDSKYLDIPQDNITFLDDTRDYNSKILYKNPGCGCISETTLGFLSDRKQLDKCNKCITSDRKKSVTEYVAKIPEEYKQYVSFVEDKGYDTRISYKNPICGCVQEITIHALLSKKQFDLCDRCHVHNKLTKKQMVESLPYLENAVVVSGYPGNRTTKVLGTCKSCGADVENYYFNLQQYYKYYGKAQCNSCMPANYFQHELFLFVKSLNVKVEENNRNTIKFDSNRHKELDIFCTDNKLAIEFNGLIWHSEKYKTAESYHYSKTKACLSLGITLLHVWEDIYLKNSEVYKSIIKTKLGLVDSRIFARKTIARELGKQDINTFFVNNHLDGSVPCITGWGLFYNNQLVQAVSVRKVNKQNKKYSGYLEVARSATLLNHLVVGGESKLLAQVEIYARANGYKGILNYVSCDFGGVVSKKGNLNYIGITDCSYCYTDGSKRISRQKLQKRKPGQTEKELAEELGLFRVNLTPNLIYTLEF